MHHVTRTGWPSRLREEPDGPQDRQTDKSRPKNRQRAGTDTSLKQTDTPDR